jgi:hypothetical protein
MPIVQAWNTVKATVNSGCFKTRKGRTNMNYKLDLQLFAEDGAAAGAAVAPTEKQPNEPGAEPKAEPKAQAKYTDDDVNRIVKQKHAEWNKNQQKAVDEAKKLAEMNAQQKAEYERDQLKKELDDLKRKDALAEMTKTARKMLTEKNINVSDELLAMMVTPDAGETKKAIDGFAKLFNDHVESAVKERLKGEPPRRGSSGGVTAKTKEQILAIRDPELRQKEMLAHRELFNF